MRENRLLSNLWLMSAATFRWHAKGAIQEAEVRDEANPDVWIQVCMRNVFFFFEVLGMLTLVLDFSLGSTMWR